MIRSRRSNSRVRSGFTLVELLATISVIFVIMGIAVVAYRTADRSARSAADRAAINGLRLAVGQFKSEFGFVPPLVKDDGGATADLPLATVRGRSVPLVFSLGSPADGEALRGRDTDRLRYSVLSLPYYILGALDGVIDGVDGLGFYEVRRDGTFAPSLAYETNPDLDPGGAGTVTGSQRSQRRYEAFFDIGRGGIELFIDTSSRFTGSGGVLTRNRIPFRFELRDRAGVAIRYYRWSPDERPLEQVFAEDGLTDLDAYADPQDSGGLEGEPGYYNVPIEVLNAFVEEPYFDESALNAAVAATASDPNADFAFPPELRSATYAILAAGPNQLFGYELGANGQDTNTALQDDEALRGRYAEQLGLSEARLGSDDDYRREAIELARADNIVEVGS
ncbi:MAG: prepilin-type N-terminal cleavage/methylation domain-containing protein [Planctomycetota bacterium]